MKGLKQMIETRRNRAAVYSRADYWDGKARALDGDAISMWANNNLNLLYNREQFELIEQWLPDVRGLRVLDIGCGTGRMSRYFERRGADVHGFDFAAKAIEIARRQSPSGTPSFEVLSIFDLDADAEYDLAVSWGVLTIGATTRDELAEAVRRVRRALKPGGVVVLLEPIHRGFLHRVLEMDVREFCDVLTESGFDVREVRHIHFWPARLALAFFPLPRWVTTPVYVVGQGVMRLCRNRAFGDYKAIYATART